MNKTLVRDLAVKQSYYLMDGRIAIIKDSEIIYGRMDDDDLEIHLKIEVDGNVQSAYYCLYFPVIIV